MNTSTRTAQNKTMHRWSWVVSLLTFSVIWVGGLVTTHDAGMAVPDWPGTYGYNLFLYPWSAWLYGPFDLLIEHGHRQLGGILGIVAIGLALYTQKKDSRKWIKRMTWFLLLSIVFQGLVGGTRVLKDDRIVALIHGIGGPLVFALAAFLLNTHSRDWWEARKEIQATGLKWLARMLFLFCVLQLVVGAHVRHSLPTWKPAFFMSFVHTHLLFAGIVATLGIATWVVCHRKTYRRAGGIIGPAYVMLLLIIGQIGLGCATWVANYALPWAETTEFFARYTIAGKGYWESLIVSGHQATGSLLIVCAVWLLCRVERRSIPRKSAVANAAVPGTLQENISHDPNRYWVAGAERS